VKRKQMENGFARTN